MLLTLHRNVKIRLLSSFFHVILGTMVMPFMVIYFATNFGPAVAGIVMIGSVVLGMLASLYGGNLSDRIGRRPIIVGGSVVSCLSYGLMAFVNSPWMCSAILTFISTTINSINFGFSSPAEDAMIIDVTDESNRKYVYGLSYWMFNLATFFGSLAGGFFFERYLFQLILGMFCFSLLSLALDYFFIQESYHPTKHRQSFKLSSYLPVIKDSAFMFFIAATTLLFSLEHQVRNYMAVRLSQEMPQQETLGMAVDGVKMYGLLLAENTLFVVVLALLVSNIIRRYKEKTVLYVGAILYVLSFTVVGVSNVAVVLLAAMLFATVGELICVPITQAMLADLPPEHNRSSYMAVRNICCRMTGVLGSLSVTAGAFLSTWAMGALFFVVGLISICLFGCFFSNKRAGFQSRCLQGNGPSCGA